VSSCDSGRAIAENDTNELLGLCDKSQGIRELDVRARADKRP
jgi:hypothetical protein